MKRLTTGVLALSLLATGVMFDGVRLAVAQEPSPTPTPTPAPAPGSLTPGSPASGTSVGGSADPGSLVPGGSASPAELRATITAVTGMVQVRADENQPWSPAVVGMILGPGAEFRTGPRSAVRFRIPPDQLITLDRLGTVKLLDAVKLSDTVVRTDIGMRYGRTNYQVEGAGAEVEHDVTIRSPAATLAVRGTQAFSHEYSALYGSRVFTINTPASLVRGGGGTPIGGQGQSQGMTDGDEHQQGHNRGNSTQNAGDQRATTGDDQQMVADLPSLWSAGNLSDDRYDPGYRANAYWRQTMLAAHQSGGPLPPGFRLGDLFTVVTTSQSSYSVRVLDVNLLDGDAIHAFYNGQSIATDLPLTAVGTVLQLDNLRMGDNYLTFESASVGIGPATTLGVQLPDGSPTIQTSIQPVGQRRSVKIIRTSGGT